jgi:hypothetical protein
MKFPKSKIGWVFVVIYLVPASFFIYQAFTCSGWVCDLIEFPATIPFGLLYLTVIKLLDPIYVFGSITYAPFRNLFFVIPMIIGNIVVYYWIGVGVGKIFKKLFTKHI